MVNLTHTGHLESEAVAIDGRSFKQVWPGGEDAMEDFNIEGRTQRHSQPLQEAEVDNGQEVKSTSASGSLKEKSKAETERSRNSQQHKNAVNGFKFLMTGCLLFFPSACGNDVSGKNHSLSRASEVKRAATLAESSIMDNARKKEANMSAEAVQQRLQCRDCTMLEPKNVNMSKKVGDKVEYEFICPSNLCEIHFCDQAEGRDIIICTGKECNPGYKIDDKGMLVFNASIETAGGYCLIDFDAKDVVGSFQLSLQDAAEPFNKSGATFNSLSSALLIAICLLVCCINQV